MKNYNSEESSSNFVFQFKYFSNLELFTIGFPNICACMCGISQLIISTHSLYPGINYFAAINYKYVHYLSVQFSPGINPNFFMSKLIQINLFLLLSFTPLICTSFLALKTFPSLSSTRVKSGPGIVLLIWEENWKYIVLKNFVWFVIVDYL